MRVLQVSIFLLLMRVATSFIIPLSLDELDDYVLYRTATFISNDVFISVYEENAYNTKLVQMRFDFAVLSSGLYLDPVPKEEVVDVLFMDPLIIIKLVIPAEITTFFDHIGPLSLFLPTSFFAEDKRYRFTYFIFSNKVILKDFAFLTDDYNDVNSTLITMYFYATACDLGSAVFARNHIGKMGIVGIIIHIKRIRESVIEGFVMKNIDKRIYDGISSKFSDINIDVHIGVPKVIHLQDYIPDQKYVVPIIVSTEDGTELKRLCSTFIHKNFALTDASFDIADQKHKILFRFELVDANLDDVQIEMNLIGMLHSRLMYAAQYRVMILPTEYTNQFATVFIPFTPLQRRQPRPTVQTRYVYFYGVREIHGKDKIIGDVIKAGYTNYFYKELASSSIEGVAEDSGSSLIKPTPGRPTGTSLLGMIYRVNDGRFLITPIYLTVLLQNLNRFMTTSSIPANFRNLVTAVENDEGINYNLVDNLKIVFNALRTHTAKKTALYRALDTIETMVKGARTYCSQRELYTSFKKEFMSAVRVFEQYFDF